MRHVIASTATRRHLAMRLLAGLVVVVPAVVLVAAPAQAVTPTITSFSPTSGTAGVSVTIRGTAFTGTTAVAFAGTAAAFTVVSATMIKATVPATAGSGPISVTTPGGSVASSASFTVNPGVGLSKASAHPLVALAVTGSGFAAFEAIDVYFDTTDVVLASTGASGAFSTTLQVPVGASPGTHWVTAVGRHSGLSAQHAFTVSTDWTMQGYGARRVSFNGYENVLSPATVAGLNQAWS